MDWGWISMDKWSIYLNWFQACTDSQNVGQDIVGASLCLILSGFNNYREMPGSSILCFIWELKKMVEFILKTQSYFRKMVYEDYPLTLLQYPLLFYKDVPYVHNQYILLRNARKINSSFTYVPRTCRGEPCVRPPNKNRLRTYARGKRFKFTFEHRFDTGFCPAGEHKVRPFIVFAHRFDTSFCSRRT